MTTSEITTHYFLGGKEIAFRKGTTLEYLHTDHLGSTSVTTNTSGAVVDTVRYFPFGGTRSSTAPLDTDKLFTGQRLDQTGLYFYNARYYDATIGRFINPDSIVPNPANPQSLNRYSYCLNNPLRYTDPSGHDTSPQQAAAQISAYEAQTGVDLYWLTAVAMAAIQSGIISYSSAPAVVQQAYAGYVGYSLFGATPAATGPSMGYEGFPTALRQSSSGSLVNIAPLPAGVPKPESQNLVQTISGIVGGLQALDRATWDALKALDRENGEDIAEALRVSAEALRNATAEDSPLIVQSPMRNLLHALGQWGANSLDREADRCERNLAEFVALNAPMLVGGWTVRAIVWGIRSLYRLASDD